MTDFERIKMYYGKGWATKAQVGKYVYFGKITPAEYYSITGDKEFLRSEVVAGKITPEEYTLITRDPYVA